MVCISQYQKIIGKHGMVWMAKHVIHDMNLEH